MDEANQLVITRTFPVQVERLWQAWTDPEQIKKWWGPKDFSAPHIVNDLRVGGTYLYAMHGPAGTEFDTDMWSTGTYTEVVPMQKIVCSDSFADEHGNIVPPSTYGLENFPQPMQVIIEFADLGDGRSRLTLTHQGAPDQGQAANMKQGWNESLDKLAESLAA